MTITIDGTRAIELLEQAVQLKGEDYVYEKAGRGIGSPTCLYLHGSDPGCLIGHAFSLAGVSNDVLAGLDACYEAGIGSSYTREVLRGAGVDISEDAFFALAAAQATQDCGLPWGEALLSAKTPLRAT